MCDIYVYRQKSNPDPCSGWSVQCRNIFGIKRQTEMLQLVFAFIYAVLVNNRIYYDMLYLSWKYEILLNSELFDRI